MGMTTTSTHPLSGAPAAETEVGHRAASRITISGNRGVKVVRAVTVRQSAAELYAFWKNVSNLALVIRHPVTITREDDLTSRWSVTTPGNHQAEWRAQIINDHPNQMLAWRTLEGADIANAGTVRFEKAPGDEGTEVILTVEYDPPGGKLGALFAKITGKEAGQQIGDTLRRFKALIETGEIPSIEGQSVGEPQQSKREKKEDETS